MLAAAHDRGIVHRDIKPENVFWMRDGSAFKVLDFGIARANPLLTGISGGFASGMVLGTPAFMPPEQALGLWDKVGAQSDLFAVGATLATLLAGRRMRQGETVMEELMAAGTLPLPPVAEMLPGLSRGVAALVDRAVAWNSIDRWADARAMQAAVLSVHAELGGEADTIACPSGAPSPMPVVITPRIDAQLPTTKAPVLRRGRHRDARHRRHHRRGPRRPRQQARPRRRDHVHDAAPRRSARRRRSPSSRTGPPPRPPPPTTSLRSPPIRGRRFRPIRARAPPAHDRRASSTPARAPTASLAPLPSASTSRPQSELPNPLPLPSGVTGDPLDRGRH